MGFQRENRFLVLKWSDIKKYLTPKAGAQDDYRESLISLVKYIDLKRAQDGKRANQYIVVNQDEPYAEQVWGLIKEHQYDN